jgi:solute carrier family 10 (sodium/bile acid cotransporter), member 7
LNILRQWISKYWFICGLVLLAVITVADRHEWTVAIGRWLKSHSGPNLVIFFIFIFSGIILDTRLLRKGFRDARATLAALIVIFLISPVLAWVYHFFPINIQILTGLFLVAVMPSTLSSGVVMTQGASGNMAHALFVTILANTMAVFTIPVALSMLLTTFTDSRMIEIDAKGIMLKIAFLVILPLAFGMIIQLIGRSRILQFQSKVQIINQLLVLMIVWMGMCQSRETIVSGGSAIFPIAFISFSYHLLLVLSAMGISKIMKIGPGRRESVIFMGGQKTLPLSVILQSTLFPEYGLALVVCVGHHIIHLVMDAYCVEKLKIAT